MEVPVFRVDSFAERPFTGNPAGVCVLDSPADDAWMQAVAAELNAPATAFVAELPDGFDLRWFTPVSPLSLCGHGTLAAAHVLWESGLISGDSIAFHTKSGQLIANRSGADIELDFPARPQLREEGPIAADLANALGVAEVHVGRNDKDFLIEVATESEVRSLTPDFARLKELPLRGVMVTAQSATLGCDFVSRFFAPSIGIDEDYATGSAHICLGPYWAAKLGKTSLTGFQASSRGATIRVRLEGERVVLAGRAITILRGKMTV